jgi:lipopolysaccharide/colanic/teichoic acid biosynthesis glycosyltransferase
MYTDSNDQIHRDYVSKLIGGSDASTNNGDADTPLYKISSDPRVTSVGEFIRKTSIDELPQLYNVLKGDMSLVGPRPPIPYEAEEYQPWHLKRILEMKPGITGLWQVEGRSSVQFDDAVRLDVRYIQTWTLLLDLKILAKTVREVLACRGAV